MKRLFTICLIAITLPFIWKCSSDSPSQYDRPHTPWVFRSVLDEQPRMITLALQEDLWVAYSTQNAAIYKVWKDGVNLDGAVYTTAHGPQPQSLGDAWLVSKHNTPWQIVRGGEELTCKIQYKGHEFKNEQVLLKYEIILPDGQHIQIQEKPEATLSERGLPGLERIFTSENVPEDITINLKTNLSSIITKDKIATNGIFKELESKPRMSGNFSTIDIDGILTLKNNDATNFAITFGEKPMIEGKNALSEEVENEYPLGYRLIGRSDCKTCHNTYVQTVGPAYLDIAKKYLNTAENSDYLISKIKNGGGSVWGSAAMSPHPDLKDRDIRAMVDYIMELDKEEEENLKAMAATKMPEDTEIQPGQEGISGQEMAPGAITNVLVFEEDKSSLSEIDWNANPVYVFVIPNINAEADDFGPLKDHFGMAVEGYLKIPASSNFVFRLYSDDGSRLIINDRKVIDNDGLHGMEYKDGEIALGEGYHPFRLEYFQNLGGRGISLKWRSFTDGEFVTVPNTAFAHKKGKTPNNIGLTTAEVNFPGSKQSLEEVHPSYDLSQARPETFLPKVGGMDFFSDGRMAVSTWDSEGAVYILNGVQTGDPSKITATKVASGLAEPLGLKIVDEEIYIMQKQELTKLLDNNQDGIIDEYQTLCNSWDVTANFHEFGFGLEYKDGYFYATLATGILPGGASALNQPKHRGNVIRVAKETGEIEFIATGLRTPNGIGRGIDDEIFVTDNQGDWLPSSKLVHISKGDWYGSRSVDFEGTEGLVEKLPVVWLPQDEIGNSPTAPSFINDGPYKGQMIHGELTHGGVKRDFVEKINGEYQGCVFRFIQGLEAGVNRMKWGPEGALYIGGVGSTGNWSQNQKLFYGLQRLQYNGKSTFEMLAVRAKSDGVEIEFTEPLQQGQGWEKSDYEILQWRYEPTENYGGPKLDLSPLSILSVNISADRKRVFLELEGMKEKHVVYIHLLTSFVSEPGQELWSSEAWYTMNNIPENNPGTRTQPARQKLVNALTPAEKAAGWQLLFDGKSTSGWRNYKKQTIGSSWIVKEGALVLDSKQKSDGSWQASDGGDIITDKTFENFELQIEWKIANCGNSGIIYNVVEDEKYDYVWQTGPEMQVLDNTCHPDAQIETHRAGDLYDMIACKYEVVKPAGEWNHVRLIINNGKAEHWLNGRKLVSFEMFTEEWKERIANSKFKDMPDFGKSKIGHIALQDHNDRVSFRNIKIREL